jgi:hypothetical protein
VKQLSHFLALAGCTSLLAACVVTPPPPAYPAPEPDPNIAARHRAEQVQQRIDHESHAIDARVSQGVYPPPRGYQLHQELGAIEHEKADMAAHHGGGLSGEEQRTLNQQLDAAARDIGG